MKAGDIVLYLESPEISYPALVLGVNYTQPGDPPVLSLAYITKADPRLEGNDWHTAVTRKGGILHYSHDQKAGKGLYDCWAQVDEGWDAAELHRLRQQDAADLA